MTFRWGITVESVWEKDLYFEIAQDTRPTKDDIFGILKDQYNMNDDPKLTKIEIRKVGTL